MDPSLYHLIVFVPVDHADRIRAVLTEHGAGKMGAYDSCSFSVRGTGRFRPLKGSTPAIGTEDRLQEVEEERIDAVLPKDIDLRALLLALKAAHPYEEPAMHMLPMLDYRTFLQD
jgi:hypothetical protein